MTHRRPRDAQAGERERSTSPAPAASASRRQPLRASEWDGTTFHPHFSLRRRCLDRPVADVHAMHGCAPGLGPTASVLRRPPSSGSSLPARRRTGAPLTGDPAVRSWPPAPCFSAERPSEATSEQFTPSEAPSYTLPLSLEMGQNSTKIVNYVLL